MVRVITDFHSLIDYCMYNCKLKEISFLLPCSLCRANQCFVFELGEESYISDLLVFFCYDTSHLFTMVVINIVFHAKI